MGYDIRKIGVGMAIAAAFLLFVLGVTTAIYPALTLASATTIVLAGLIVAIFLAVVTPEKEKVLAYAAFVFIVLILQELFAPLVGYLIGVIF